MGTLPTVQTHLVASPTALRLEQIRNRIRVAAEGAGRNAESVKLIGSSRSLMVDPVVEAVKAGVFDLCEDYLPEGVTKRTPVDHLCPGVTWHFSGTLLDKTMAIAVEFFDWIHSIDRPTLLRSLKSAVEKKRKNLLQVLIEVNPLGDLKRSGVTKEELAFLIESVQKIPHVKLQGLSFKSELSLNDHIRMEAFEVVGQWAKEFQMKEVAMGTSKDFEVAIRNGATMIRVGKALFGSPPSSGLVDT